MSNGVSVPSDFPHVSITNSIYPSSEYVFINTRQAPYYSIIFDTRGDPVWYRRTPDRRDDFKIQANGWITMLVGDGYGGSGPGFIALDQNFEFIKSMRATNGYATDDHDFYVLPDSGYILIGQKETTVDMSEYVTGGRTDATVLETCIQEFTADDQLVYTWSSWDHFDIRDLELESLTSGHIRFPHINAIDIDEDGQLLISSRHLSEISKINRQSREFIWRWCGVPDSPNNDFQFDRDHLNGFRNQHSITSLGNQSYLLFDNGNLHPTPSSRAVEYELDTVQMRATMVWEFKNAFDRGVSRQLGNSQRLVNGNTHVNWAFGEHFPIATEVTPEGETVFEMWFTNGERCYRSFRYPWKGECNAPYLILEAQVDKLTLLFNKFGDKDVAYYNIYGGTTSGSVNLIGTSTSTLKELHDLEKSKHHFFRVTAVDSDGTESEFSNEVDIWMSNTEPGSNIILNGEFDKNIDPWIFETEGSASAEMIVIDSICKIIIEGGGGSYQDIRLYQNNVQLIQGQEYLLTLEAWSDEVRAMEILLRQDQLPFSDYSRIGYSALSTTKKQYSYSFPMEDATDLNACIAINAGVSTSNIYLDNISLKMNIQSMSDKHIQPLNRFHLYPNYPNPFTSITTIAYSLSEPAFVNLVVYDALGQKVAELMNEVQVAGRHKSLLELDGYYPGVYTCSLEVRAIHSSNYYRQTRKMVLIK